MSICRLPPYRGGSDTRKEAVFRIIRGVHMFYYKLYRQEPDREWVVLLHGLGGSSAIWYKQTEAWAQHFNLVLVDLYGHGRTRKTLPEYSFEEMGGEVFRVMDHLGLESAHLAGISFGSVLAKVMCAMAPHRVRSLVLGGAVPSLDFRSRFLMHTGRLFRPLMPYMWLYRLFARIIMPRKRHAKSRNIFVREAGKLGRPEFQKWYRLIQTYQGFSRELRRNLRRTGVPKLFISGGEDHLFLGRVRDYVRSDPQAVLHVVNKCGHVCNVEKSAEFNHVSLHYLTGALAYERAEVQVPDVAPGQWQIPVEGKLSLVPLRGNRRLHGEIAANAAS